MYLIFYRPSKQATKIEAFKKFKEYDSKGYNMVAIQTPLPASYHDEEVNSHYNYMFHELVDMNHVEGLEFFLDRGVNLHQGGGKFNTLIHEYIHSVQRYMRKYYLRSCYYPLLRLGCRSCPHNLRGYDEESLFEIVNHAEGQTTSEFSLFNYITYLGITDAMIDEFYDHIAPRHSGDGDIFHPLRSDDILNLGRRMTPEDADNDLAHNLELFFNDIIASNLE